MRIFLIVSLLVLNITHAQQYGGTQDYGSQGAYEEYSGGGPDQGQGKGTKGKTGVERKSLLGDMDISDKTKLDEREKCNTKCDMTFIQCYRIQTDRAKCYSTKQECLGKCGGDVDASSEFESAPPRESGGELRFP